MILKCSVHKNAGLYIFGVDFQEGFLRWHWFVSWTWGTHQKPLKMMLVGNRFFYGPQFSDIPHFSCLDTWLYMTTWTFKNSVRNRAEANCRTNQFFMPHGCQGQHRWPKSMILFCSMLSFKNNFVTSKCDCCCTMVWNTHCCGLRITVWDPKNRTAFVAKWLRRKRDFKWLVWEMHVAKFLRCLNVWRLLKFDHSNSASLLHSNCLRCTPGRPSFPLIRPRARTVSPRSKGLIATNAGGC